MIEAEPMGNYPKRLCDAWVGAAVQRVAPHAVIWAPRFRPVEGAAFGSELAGSLVLQCSWAQQRGSGPSTRVNSRQVSMYGAGALARWRSSVRFVLVGSAPSTPGQLDCAPALFTISLADLRLLVDQRQRGTVDARTLAELRLRESIEGGRAVAEPLEAVIEAWVGAPPIAASPVPSGAARQTNHPGHPRAERIGFSFQGPTPIAVRAPWRATASDETGAAGPRMLSRADSPGS